MRAKITVCNGGAKAPNNMRPPQYESTRKHLIAENDLLYTWHVALDQTRDWRNLRSHQTGVSRWSSDQLVNRGSSGAAQRPLPKENLFLFIAFWLSNEDRLQREIAIGVRSPTILAKDLVPLSLAPHGASLLWSLHFFTSHFRSWSVLSFPWLRRFSRRWGVFSLPFVWFLRKFLEKVYNSFYFFKKRQIHCILFIILTMTSSPLQFVVFGKLACFWRNFQAKFCFLWNILWRKDLSEPLGYFSGNEKQLFEQ